MAQQRSHNKKKRLFTTNQLATYGVMIALALVFGYVESLIPLPFTVPGVKLGLGNIVVLFALYAFGALPAFMLMLIKVIASSVLFGNPSIFLYSIAGGVLSYTMMVLAKKSGLLSVTGVSIVGGIFHNIGQLLVVLVIFNYLVVLANLPILLIAGIITGLIIGQITALALKSVPQLYQTRDKKAQKMKEEKARLEQEKHDEIN